MVIRRWLVAFSFVATAGTLAGSVHAQQARATGPAPDNQAAATRPGDDPPADFVIGPEDVLSIVFWRNKDMSTEVTVRPDGKISLPLLNDVHAAGLTPAGLCARLAIESKRFFENPNVTVVVKQINSRKVYITGQVVKPGLYALAAPTTVLQLIAMAGGLKDFAERKNIMVVRYENGQRSSFVFNYKEIGRNLQQDVALKPGDTVVVP